jgi:hypothetical protein
LQECEETQDKETKEAIEANEEDKDHEINYHTLNTIKIEDEDPTFGSEPEGYMPSQQAAYMYQEQCNVTTETSFSEMMVLEEKRREEEEEEEEDKKSHSL